MLIVTCMQIYILCLCIIYGDMTYILSKLAEVMFRFIGKVDLV